MSDKGTSAAAETLPLLLSVTETSNMTGLSKITVRRRVNSGDWPGGRSGRKLLIPRAFVLDFVKAIESGTQLVNAESYAIARAAARQAEAS